MQHLPSFDSIDFRNVLSTFATGVTIITARSSQGEPVGITANSFNSVSLDPPMILWSLAKTARSLQVFNTAELWAVHILSVYQETLSNRFALSGADKFAGLDVQLGIGKLPLLTGCSARLQCKTAFKTEAGDHIVFLGEVLDFDRYDLPPLVFHDGRYSIVVHMHATTSDLQLQKSSY
jgi:3-hydroxy-9,10-secoandrosta-1,3,5(10)-triene-9,17-dione monooxygenase reductase component